MNHWLGCESDVQVTWGDITYCKGCGAIFDQARRDIVAENESVPAQLETCPGRDQTPRRI